jgi:hypothetical protein
MKLCKEKKWGKKGKVWGNIALIFSWIMEELIDN